MYKDVLNSIDGVEFFPIVSLVIFFGFFVGLIIWMVRTDKTYFREMAELPLESNANYEPRNQQQI